MATTRDKAEELIKKHLNYFTGENDEKADWQAQQSAIITCEEIIADLKSYRFKSYLTVNQAATVCNYWYQVMNEIEGIINENK